MEPGDPFDFRRSPLISSSKRRSRRRVRVARNHTWAPIPLICGQDNAGADSKRLSMPTGHWDGLPDGLLAACVLPLAQRDNQEDSAIAAAARATCRQWRHAVDKNLTQLRPSRWPRGSLARFPAMRVLDLSCLLLDEEEYLQGPSVADPCGSLVPPSCTHAAAAAAASNSSSSNSSSRDSSSSSCTCGHSSNDLLMGATVLQSKMWDDSDGSSSVASTSIASSSMDCLVRVRAGHSSSAALTSYVASRWPEAVQHVTPAACLRIWRELPALPALQALAINGAMLLVKSVRTTVDPFPDAAAGLGALQQEEAGNDGSAAASITITHWYTLQLPSTVCQLTGLQALSVAWQLLTTDAGSCSSNEALHQGGLVLRGRRRSYEGPPLPNVVHIADPLVQLPSEFSRLTSLQQLSLAGSICGADALAPLAALGQLRQLALGPGELDLQALLQLRSTVVPRLRQLVLSQQAAWDARALAALLAAAQQLQELEIDEREIKSPSQDISIPPEHRLTEADMAPLAATLQSLAWTTCAQRLCTGSSLLGRNAATGAAMAGPDALQVPGAWLGSLMSLRQLCISGWPSGSAVLSAPVLEVVSSSIGSCLQLEELLIHGLGVPLLPPALAQLPALHTVSIASTAMVRRTLLPAERSLEVLGSCSGLRSLTLAGCELRQLPEWLLGLQQLTQLQLQGNYLQDLPGGLSTLGLPAGLRLLNLSDNRLRDLPAGIAGLSSLEQLHLDQNYLSSLPAQIWQLPSLEVLSARENMLPSLPEFIGTGSCSKGSASGSARQQPRLAAGLMGDSLLLLDDDEEMAAATGVMHSVSHGNAASQGSCSSAPSPGADAGVASCHASNGFSSRLKDLVLADNQLCQLPSSFSRLTALERLDLDSNQLRLLPEAGSLWCLTRLTALQLNHNHLKKLPAGLSRLQRLVELDVSGNHLPASSCPGAAAAAAVEGSSAGAAPPRPSPLRSSLTPPVLSAGASVAGAAVASAAAAAASASRAAGVVASAGAGRVGSQCRTERRSIASVRQQLPGPLRGMLQLQQLRMGGQHAEERAGHQCPLQLLLGGLCDLVEKLRSLAPAHHTCPVSRAAAAAVAHITAATSGKRAKKDRRKQLLEAVHTEPGWLVVAATAGPIAGAEGAGVAAVAKAWDGGQGVAVV